jgi:hypothetical protein
MISYKPLEEEGKATELVADLLIKLSLQQRAREKQEELKVQTIRNNSAVHLGLKLINEALSVTARKVHNYDTLRLQQQGTTATHIVYGSVSKFDTFFTTFLEVALTHSHFEKLL